MLAIDLDRSSSFAGILIFLRRCMDAAILKIAVDFYLRRQESVLQPGSSNWARINRASFCGNVNGTTEVGQVRTEPGTVQPS